MNVSQVVRGEVAKRFDAGDAAVVLRAFYAATLPLLDGETMRRDVDRVHCAILKLGDGDVGRVLGALGQATVDWRDVLVAAGLGNADWPIVLREAGFPDLWPELQRRAKEPG